jgi:hypothetical protein
MSWAIATQTHIDMPTVSSTLPTLTSGIASARWSATLTTIRTSALSLSNKDSGLKWY